jgi:hypothetical protein
VIKSLKKDVNIPKGQSARSDGRAAITLPGTVEKVIPPIDPQEPEKAQIGVHGADHLYREIRVDNVLKDAKGQDVSLKPGADVEVTIQADPAVTTPKQSPEATVPRDSAEKSDHK